MGQEFGPRLADWFVCSIQYRLKSPGGDSAHGWAGLEDVWCLTGNGWKAALCWYCQPECLKLASLGWQSWGPWLSESVPDKSLKAFPDLASEGSFTSAVFSSYSWVPGPVQFQEEGTTQAHEYHEAQFMGPSYNYREPRVRAPPAFLNALDSFSPGSLAILFFFFWLLRVFVAARRLSLVAASGGYSSLRCAGFLLRWFVLLGSTGSRHVDFSSCSTWAQ